MTPDERIVQAFLVADEVLRRAPPQTVFGIDLRVDARMPAGMAALGSATGPIVVKDLL